MLVVFGTLGGIGAIPIDPAMVQECLKLNCPCAQFNSTQDCSRLQAGARDASKCSHSDLIKLHSLLQNTKQEQSKAVSKDHELIQRANQ
jgi:hypothetical protein